MKGNRKYKDSVFCDYMSDGPKLVELYNAVYGTNYPFDTPVEINTLDNVLYMDRVNDISFTLDGKYVVLLEQQSTIKMNCKFCAIINGEHEISGDARKYFSYANCRFIEYHRNEQNEIDGATIACDLGHGYGFDNVDFYIGPIIPENWK